MILAIDIGNTHTNIGIANSQKIHRSIRLPTELWEAKHLKKLFALVRCRHIEAISIASVVPHATRLVKKMLTDHYQAPCIILKHSNVVGIGIDYPKPDSIGADRLANAIAAADLFGAPVVVVDFGTAVTFDVIDRRAFYVGGIIAPGLGFMTDYLHEKTALLPKIRIQNPKRIIGKSTREAMQIGAVKGYRGLIATLIADLKRDLNEPNLRVVTTGGDAALMAEGLPQIFAVCPRLTLEGLRLLAMHHFKISVKKKHFEKHFER